jgi:hypothetical protein
MGKKKSRPPTLVKMTDFGYGSCIVIAFLLSQSDHEAAQNVTLDLIAVITSEIDDNVCLFRFEFEEWSNESEEMACLGSGHSPEIIVASYGPLITAKVNSATKLEEPLNQTVIAVTDLEGGSDVLFQSPSKTDAAFTVDDPSEISKVEFLHPFIISLRSNKGRSVACHLPRKARKF